MTPRRYTQSRRAAAAEETRARIIDAAIAEYRARGVLQTSIQSVAQRADVSRGTVLNHFGDSDGLLAAVLETASVSLQLPDERVLEGAKDVEERARRYAREMLTFYDRTSDWWQVFAGARDELPAVPALQDAEQRFWEAVRRFQEAALGPLASESRVIAAMAIVISWTTLDAIHTTGLELATGIELASEMFSHAVRHAAQSSGG